MNCNSYIINFDDIGPITLDDDDDSVVFCAMGPGQTLTMWNSGKEDTSI